MRVENSEALEAIFGGWPSFHDSEVIAIRLQRGGSNEARPSVEIDVHLWETTSETDGRGLYRLKHHTITTLRFDDVDEVDVVGFNEQNVLFDLAIDQSETYAQRWHVSLTASYGVDASFDCASVAVVRVEPWRGG
jgi:hypothetical protein